MRSRAIILFMTTCLVTATAAPLAAHAAPTNVSVVAGRGRATISWTGIRNTDHRLHLHARGSLTA